MIFTSHIFLILSMFVKTFLTSDYDVPVDDINYDDIVITQITTKYNKLVRPIETVSLTLKVNSFFTQWLFKGILIF